MPIELLTLLKFGLLLLLYLFLGSTVRAVVVDLYGPRRKSSTPPRQAIAPAAGTSAEPRKARRVPKEIVIHHAGAKAQVVGLRGDHLTLGRAGHVDIPIDDVYISDEHASVQLDSDGWVVRDLGSTNGTFLNGAKVARPTPIAAGDQLRVGKTHIEVRR
jgi:pSer/pThr/pTyr-binding forkhead associated (FHA) protein